MEFEQGFISERREMLWTDETILILLLHVAAECCIPGHICMARCIRLLCNALIYDISIWNAVLPSAWVTEWYPGFFYAHSHPEEIWIAQILIIIKFVRYMTERGGTIL